MYKNLEAEMTRNSISSYDIAKVINKSYNTTREKLTGKSPLHLNEAIKIKRQFFPNSTLDYLFDIGDAV